LALAEKVVARSVDAGLPRELVPASLGTVVIEGEGSAEHRLRTDVLAFADRIRAVEDAADAVRGERRALSAADWYEFWPRA